MVMSTSRARWSGRSFHRILIDMHIPDWDPRFLCRFSADGVVEAIERSGADAAMLYFNSHVGLCNWRTDTGMIHAAMLRGDPLGEIVTRLRARSIPTSAYYSVTFNNWAYHAHPEWRFVPATRNSMGSLPAERYGLCCQNNNDYRNFVSAQVTEILADYDVDAMFFDMMWQPGICKCEQCRARFEREEGLQY